MWPGGGGVRIGVVRRRFLSECIGKMGEGGVGIEAGTVDDKFKFVRLIDWKLIALDWLLIIWK